MDFGAFAARCGFVSVMFDVQPFSLNHSPLVL